MAQGFSGSYAINGVNFTLQPTQGNWAGRNLLGIDGEGHAIYPTIREFEVSWGIMSTAELKQIIDAQLAAGNTGTLVFDLPKWGDVDYKFFSYSGCTLREPEVGPYFAGGWIEDVKLIITNIRTN